MSRNWMLFVLLDLFVLQQGYADNEDASTTTIKPSSATLSSLQNTPNLETYSLDTNINDTHPNSYSTENKNVVENTTEITSTLHTLFNNETATSNDTKTITNMTQTDGTINNVTAPLEYPINNQTTEVIINSKTILANNSSINNKTASVKLSKNEGHFVPPPLQFPTDSKMYKVITNEEIASQLTLNITTTSTIISTPPSIFPSQSDGRYTFVKNSSIINNLLGTSSEAVDMMKPTSEENTHYIPQLPNGDIEEESINNDKDVVEETTSNDTDKSRIKVEGNLIINDEDKRSSQGEVAVILTVIFVLMAAIAYAALMSWRMWLEKRYGSRQLLVEDDDDLKHFSI